MDELPDQLSRAIGDAEVIDTIDIGGGDTIVITPETTYVYRSDGLIRDETVEAFGHAVNRLSLRSKRRKSAIQLEGIDSEESFTVPSKIVDDVVEGMVQGILLTNEIIDADEAVLSLFRFSELTLVVTEQRLFEHIGNAVWDDDADTVEYADLTGLDFERGSVATQVVLETNDRRRRVKVPNEQAGAVRRAIQNAVFDFHGVESLEEFEATRPDPSDEEDSAAEVEADTNARNEKSGFVDSGDESSADSADDFVSAGWTPPAENSSSSTPADQELSSSQTSEDGFARSASSQESTAQQHHVELDSLSQQVETLSRQVQRQTDLIESQQELIEQLVDELRRGR